MIFAFRNDPNLSSDHRNPDPSAVSSRSWPAFICGIKVATKRILDDDGGARALLPGAPFSPAG